MIPCWLHPMDALQSALSQLCPWNCLDLSKKSPKSLPDDRVTSQDPPQPLWPQSFWFSAAHLWWLWYRASLLMRCSCLKLLKPQAIKAPDRFIKSSIWPLPFNPEEHSLPYTLYSLLHWRLPFSPQMCQVPPHLWSLHSWLVGLKLPLYFLPGPISAQGLILNTYFPKETAPDASPGPVPIYTCSIPLSQCGLTTSVISNHMIFGDVVQW